MSELKALFGESESNTTAEANNKDKQSTHDDAKAKFDALFKKD